MNNLLILPLLIPLLTGILLIFFRERITVQKWMSVISLGSTLVFSLYLVHMVSVEGIQTLRLGGWEPPFGIIFVLDMFSALLVSTTAIVSLCCVLFAFRSIGVDREYFYFYPFMLFLVTGVNGSFLTGDIFNLFVCFEVMLISSYALIVLGGTKRQLRESIKYVLINIISSALFVIAVAYLYAITGTLNMADLSLIVTEIMSQASPSQQGLVTVVAILFLIVFGLKAGLFLYFWLPGSYSAPPTAIAAIFGGLLTKVGVYAIIRTFSLIFYQQPEITHLLISWLAGLTMIIGTIGLLAHMEIRKILAYNVVAAVGFILFGFSIFTTTAIEGAIFYLIHDMIIKAALFLLGGAIIAISGTSKLKEMGGLIKNHPRLGWMFFIVAISLAGVPPLSGFIGKLLIVQGGLDAGFYWLTGISLVSSLFILFSVMKVFMNVFWGETKLSLEEEKGTFKGLAIPCAILILLSIGIGLGAEWLYGSYITDAAKTIMDPALYIEAVSPVKE